MVTKLLDCNSMLNKKRLILFQENFRVSLIKIFDFLGDIKTL